MPKLLIVSENAAEAFHTQQILSEHFSDVRVCNRLDTAKELSSTFAGISFQFPSVSYLWSCSFSHRPGQGSIALSEINDSGCWPSKSIN